MLSICDVVVDPELESLLRPLNQDESNKLTTSILRSLCSIHGHKIPWEDLDLESRVNCHRIAQSAIATVLNSGYSFAGKNLGGDNDETVE